MSLLKTAQLTAAHTFIPSGTAMVPSAEELSLECADRLKMNHMNAGTAGDRF